MEGFCDRLRALRNEADLSQHEMAAKLGITRAGYQMIENGRNGKKFLYLPMIAKAIGCRIDDLFPEMDMPTEVEDKTERADGFDGDDDLKGWSE